MSFDWYPWDRAAYKKKTAHLTLAEDGAYRRLIDEYMAAGGPLPDNDRALARLIGSSLDEWMAVAAVVREFFKASHGKLINERCEEELHAQSMQQARRTQKARDAANALHKRNREIKEIVATSMPRANGEHANPVLKPATRQDKDITTTFSVAASAEEQLSARSLASAPNRGALAREPCTEPAAKRPSELSRAELDAVIARRNVSQ